MTDGFQLCDVFHVLWPVGPAFQLYQMFVADESGGQTGGHLHASRSRIDFLKVERLFNEQIDLRGGVLVTKQSKNRQSLFLDPLASLLGISEFRDRHGCARLVTKGFQGLNGVSHIVFLKIKNQIEVGHESHVTVGNDCQSAGDQIAHLAGVQFSNDCLDAVLFQLALLLTETSTQGETISRQT